MSKAKLIAKYENMMYEYDECDIWEDDIQPKLVGMTYAQIKKMYDEDKEYYECRKHRTLN